VEISRKQAIITGKEAIHDASIPFAGAALSRP
jgi:hypothetical protein